MPREAVMIDRYTLPEMGTLWSNVTKYKKWLRIEVAVMKARVELGQIPAEALDYLDELYIDELAASAIERWEKVTKHDLNAFVDIVRLQAGTANVYFRMVCSEKQDEVFFSLVREKLVEINCPTANYFHDGLTSYDTEEPAMSLLYLEACDIISGSLDEFIKVLTRRAYEHRQTIMIGRTHGQHAQPTTFGKKLFETVNALQRAKTFFETAREGCRVMKLSGAVGMYGTIGPDVEKKVGEMLYLRPIIASQIISLDIRAQVIMQLALIASTVDKLVCDLRDMSKTELREVREPFGKGQVGSSAMPHKKNPITLENSSGLVRFIRTAVIPMLENVATSHERDISHSSVERTLGVDAFIATHKLLSQMTRVVDKMDVFPKQMLKNIGLSHGTWASQKVTMILERHGMPAKRAYEIVQEASFQAMTTERDLRELLISNQEVSDIRSQNAEANRALANCFDPYAWVDWSDFILEREGCSTK